MAMRKKDRKDDGGDSRPDEDKQKADGYKKALILCILAMPVLIAFYGVVLWWSNPHTPGDELRVDQYLNLLRQGRITNATILELDNRMVGDYEGGKYWVAFSGGRETLFSRLASALEDAGIPVKVKQQP
ncbi:MAG: hypothetical protein ACRD0D_08745, partial [Acidimicrobiales bacterium]